MPFDLLQWLEKFWSGRTSTTQPLPEVITPVVEPVALPEAPQPTITSTVTVTVTPAPAPSFKRETVKVPPSNYGVGRQGTPITHIVIHTMQGTYEGTKNWFAQPQAGVSAHYGISFEGTICQFLDDANTGYHAGNLNYNRCSIGIELEGFQEKGFFPEPMMEALAGLVKELSAKHGVAMDRQHIIGHNEVPDPHHAGEVGGAQHHKDPGAAFPWERFMASLKA